MTSIQKTTTTKVTKTTTTETCSSPQITITKRGGFFDDSFFEDRRQDYQVAIKDVLSKFGDQTTKSDELTTYRNLRTKDLREENQAVRSTQDDRFYKIVIDVQDFAVGGEVNVKTVDEQKVVIEGRVQRQEGNSTSSKSFKKTFIYSDADMENISSVMSSDGILTVTVPRKQQQLQQITTTVTQQQQQQQQQQVQQQQVQQQVVQQQQVQQQQVQQQVVQQQQQVTQKTTSIQQGDRTLTITQKGNFFDDSFFEDARKPFQEAIQQVLQKSNVTTSQDQITSYRDLRQKELKDETQAAIQSDDQNRHKIIVDVQDFIHGGEVTVKTVDDREVVIEGTVKRQEGNKTSSKSFRKRYVLPEDIQTEEVTSVVSADGVLTIIAPKKPQALLPGQVSVPVAIQQQTDANKQVMISNTTNTALQSTDQTQVASQDTQQQNVTVQKKVTTVTQQSTVTTDGSTCSSPTDKSLTITKKGDFFSDTFFEDARQPFQEAVRNVLQKSNVTTTQTNEIQSYRDLRQKELKDETQAATTSDDQNQHKIIVDVQDFINGDVKVKTVDDREVVIEGSITKQEGNKTSSKSFRKRFVLPDDIQTESVTSVVSSDGILTIIAPKKPESIQPKQVSVPLSIQDSNINKQVVATDTTNTSQQSISQTDTQSAVAQQQTQQQDVVVQKKVTTVTQQSNVTTDSSTCSTPTDKSLTITRKGDFFDDSFFEDARKPFQEAVRNVLQKSNVTTTQTNEIQSYRDLRQRELKEETQAATTSDDQNQHKIIVDVQDFINGGEVIVKTVDEREVIIEGSIKKQEGNTTSSKSFRKRYVLPQDIVTEKVTSVVSSDGVLTIIAPKKPQAIQPGEVSVPVAIQDSNKQVMATDTSNTTMQSVKQETSTQKEVASQQAQQENVVVQKKVTTVTQQSNVTTDSSTCSSPTDKSLTITKKGDFFSDSFFEDARKPFQEAIRNVLQKSNVTTTQTNEIQSYRDLRQKELKEETQAATTSDDQNQHKIIVDVQDFINGGEVVVKTVDEREVVIEGSIKKQEGNTVSSKSFRKRYVLPDDIQTEKVTSVVSSDGVLTIIAPKKPQAIQPVDISRQVVTADTTAVKQSEITSQQVQQQQIQQQQVQQQQIQQQQTQQQQNQEQNVVVQKKVTTVTQQSNVTDSSTCSTPTDKSLTITKKGDFFIDSFFEDARKPFEEAVRSVLQKSNVTTTQTNQIQSYRDLRQKELKEETQAATTSDDQNRHKIIVDVQDFINGGEVVVKTVDEREVIIEGSIKKQEGNTISSKSFRKRYVLPEDIQTEQVTSVVSSDGILTIIAPKKLQALQPGETVVPLAIQQPDKQVVTADTTNKTLQSVSQTTKTQSEVAQQQTQQQDVVVQKKVTTVTQQSNVTTDSSTCSSPTDKSLTITKKGDFFTDSFFEDARQPFQEAIRNVLQKSNITKTQTSEIQTYRDLRQRELKDETQAAITSDDQNRHKIIVDVQDFINGGDVVVKTIDDREVVIEGSIKKQEGNRTSSKSFRKRYVLPEDIQTESVTSVVSADGVLTIIAPKKVSAPKAIETVLPLSMQKTEDNKQVTALNTTKSVALETQRSMESEQVTASNITKSVVQATQHSTESEQVASSNTTKSVLQATQQSTESKQMTASDTSKSVVQSTQQSTESKQMSASSTSESVFQATQQSSESKQMTASSTTKSVAQSTQQSTESASQQIQQNVSVQKKMTKTSQQKSSSSTKSKKTSSSETTKSLTTSSDRSLVITKKGSFFNDTFFEDARKPFQEAIKNVLKKSKVTVSKGDELTSYRNLRQRNLKDETQASTISDDQRQHKIILDVQDFINGGEVTVKTIGEKEVIVEGQVEKDEGDKIVVKKFRRRYVLPEEVVSDAVTSVVSSDGVMTIVAPKKTA